MRLKNIFTIGASVTAVFLGFSGLVFAESGVAAAACAFDGNLEVGSVKEEVRCLQKYLNSNGFKIAEVGVGSPGNETQIFGELTKEAVKRWQVANDITPTGTFGPISQEKYLKRITSLLTAQVSNLNPDTLVSTQPIANYAPVQTEKDKQEKEARTLIKKARDILEKTQDDVDDASANDLDKDEANDDIEDAEDDLLDALYSFVDEEYAAAINKAGDVIESMGDIQDEIHGDDEDAKDAISDAKKAINKAKNDIQEADDDGDHVDRAKDLLENAEDKLDDAEEAFDDEDFDKAESFAKQAENLADDARDAIGD